MAQFMIWLSEFVILTGKIIISIQVIQIKLAAWIILIIHAGFDKIQKSY